jgi:hypothetical protein
MATQLQPLAALGRLALCALALGLDVMPAGADLLSANGVQASPKPSVVPTVQSVTISGETFLGKAPEAVELYATVERCRYATTEKSASEAENVQACLDHAQAQIDELAQRQHPKSAALQTAFSQARSNIDAAKPD